MKRFVHSFLVAAALALVPRMAVAQTGTTATTTATTAIQLGLVVERDGKQLKNDSVIYVTRKQCIDNPEYVFSVKYTNPVPVTEVWVGVGSEDCSSVASRQNTTISSNPACKLVGRAGSSLNPKIRAHTIDLFSVSTSTITDTDDAGTETDAGTDAGDSDDASVDSDAEVPVDEVGSTGAVGCDAATQLAYKVYFIPLPQPTNLGANKAYEPLAATSYGYSTLVATFTLFTELPSAPGNLSAKSGETEIGVRFTPLSGALAKTTYRAYFDWGSGGDECGSGALAKDQPPPSEDDTITSVSATAGKGTLASLDDKNIPLDSLVAASVVTVDPAGNESNLSAVICVKREETINFIDRCETDPDCKLESCSLRPAARTGGLVGISLLCALGVALFVRRRHV